MTKTFWWRNDTRTLNIRNFRKIRKANKAEFGDDPDINTKRKWGIRTNGAVKGIHRCLDWTLSLGHIEINYINWTYNE